MKPINQPGKGIRNDPSDAVVLNAQPRRLSNHSSSYALKSPATKSLLKFRQRQEIQKSLKARQYKSYKRVMKQEGFDLSNGHLENRQSITGQGIDGSDGFQEMNDVKPKSQVMLIDEKSTDDKSQKSKSFDSTGRRPGNSESPSKESVEYMKRSLPDSSSDSKVFRGQKTHRITKRQQQKWKEKEHLERQQFMEEEKGRKLKERQQRHKLLSARTPRGQPIMNNLVQDILRKLQNEQASEDK